MRQKETPHKSASKPVLPSVIEFSILGPNWFDDSFLGSVDVSQLDTPESIPLAPLPSSLEEKKEPDTEALSSTVESSPSNTMVRS